ncbi:MAG: S8 family serine peptidase [Armatimonadetes bacterium]|nr:S8 family serine peptidase [Armatimonadota bacterium]
MKFHFRLVASAALGLAIAASSIASTIQNIPGVQEFTGQMIVRPLQVDDMMAKNWTADKITTARNRAKGRLRSNYLRYHPETDEYVVRVPWGKNEVSYSAELMRTGDYQYACPNYRLYPTNNPNDPLFSQQWHHQTIQSPLAWNFWTGGSNFEVTFVDTGITKTHPDLKDLLLPGYNSVDRKTEAEGGDITDINGHGTHVSGCGAAAGNNGVGVSGVGWNFKIRFVKTSNVASGGAAFDDIMTGARWAVDHGSKTISASYSGVDNDVVSTTGTYIKSKGGLFLYAAGNDARDLSGFSYDDVIVCGASNEQDGKASFSAYGRGVGVFAPGTNILSTTMDGAYGLASGTSMATPVTNGAVATIWSVNPTLTPDEVQTILYNTCDNIGSSSIFGHGRINVFRGVLLSLSTLARDTTISDVGVQTGTYSSGNLGSVQDSNLNNAYKVNSVYSGAIGTIAATNMACSLPTDQGTISSFSLAATFKVTGTKPTSVLGYVLNVNTGNYDLVSTKGAFPNTDTTINLKLGSATSNYVASDGTVKVILRSVVPSRFGKTNNQLLIGYAKGRYSIAPTF